MDLGLNGKTALLLGSSKGIGFGVAKELLKEKSRVIICSRNPDNLKSAEEQLRDEFPEGDIHSFKADTSKKEDLESLFNYMKQDFGVIHMILNNTGGPPAGEFLDVTEEQWETSFQSLLMSSVRIVRGLFPLFSKEGSSIVNVLSRSAKAYLPNLVLSNTFRPAIAGLAKTLSIELAPYGVRVNNACPGSIATQRHEELVIKRALKNKTDADSVKESIASKIPLGRIGSPEDMATLIVYLFSPRSSYITGQTVLVDGGSLTSI